MLIAGGLLIADTLFLLAFSNARNLGIYMPLLLGLPLAAAGIILCFFPDFFTLKIGIVLKWLGIIGYSAFTLLFCLTSVLAYTAGHTSPPDNADVLVVLGCGIKGTKVTLTLSRRLDCAIEYLNGNENTVVIVSGGKGKNESISEAQAMAEYLIQHGIASERIIQESNSHSTQENFIYSKQIIDKLYPEGAKVCFVTTAFHVFRAERVAEHCGLDAQGIGANGVKYIALNDYLRECVTITVYFLKGRL